MRKITLLTLLTLSFYSCSKKEPKITREDFLIKEAKKEILNRLKSPTSAIFIDSISSANKFKGSDSLFSVRISLDAKNAFGTMLRKRYKLIYGYHVSKKQDTMDIKNYKLVDIF